MKSHSSRGATPAANPARATHRPKAPAAPPVAPHWNSGWILLLVFWVVAWPLVYYGVNTVVRFQVSAPAFFADSFLPDLNTVGGLLAYGSAFIAQIDSNPALGACITVLEGSALFLVTRRLMSRLAFSRAESVAWIPPCLWLVMQVSYPLQTHQITIGLILTIGAMALIANTTATNPPLRCLAGAILSLLLLWICGAIPALLFSLLFGITGARTRPMLVAASVWIPLVLVSGAAWLVGNLLRQELQQWHKGLPFAVCSVLHLYYPTAAMALMFTTGREGNGNMRVALMQKPGIPLALVLVMVSGLLSLLSIDRRQKAENEIGYLAQEGRWAEVLEVGRRLHEPGSATRLEIDRAMFYSGRLGNEFFSFPRSSGQPLLPALNSGMEVAIPLSQTLFDLGQVNVAEHYAQEGMELFGQRASTLKLLVKIYLLKGYPEAARVFVGRLQKNPFESAWAHRYLSAIDAGDGLKCDPQLGQLTSLTPRTDEPYSTVDAESMLADLSAANATNRMAFEYLTAHYLMTRNLEKIAEQAQKLTRLGYKAVPTNYEEALLLYEQLPGSRKVDLNGLSISRETKERFERINNWLRQGKNKLDTIRTGLAAEFGDTFWFYYLYGGCPGRRDGGPRN